MLSLPHVPVAVVIAEEANGTKDEIIMCKYQLVWEAINKCMLPREYEKTLLSMLQEELDGGVGRNATISIENITGQGAHYKRYPYAARHRQYRYVMFERCWWADSEQVVWVCRL